MSEEVKLSRSDKLKGKCQEFGTFLYDPREGKILSRTPLSWLKLTTFTLCYWILIVIFSMVCWEFFFVVQYGSDPEMPVWRRQQTIVSPGILTNPELNLKHAPSVCPLCLAVSINCIFNWKPIVPP